MEQIPRNRKIPTNTLQRKKKQTLQRTRPTNQRRHSRNTHITLLELIEKLSIDLTEGGLSFHLKKMRLTFKKVFCRV